MYEENKTLRLQHWITKNFDDWSTICGTGKFPIDEQEFMRLMKVLVDNDFEEMTLVLINCHFYAIQNRAQKARNIIADACEDELRHRGVEADK